jgi:hypothetical protein
MSISLSGWLSRRAREPNKAARLTPRAQGRFVFLKVRMNFLTVIFYTSMQSYACQFAPEAVRRLAPPSVDRKRSIGPMVAATPRLEARILRSIRQIANLTREG